MPDYAVCVWGMRFWKQSALNSTNLPMLLIGIVRGLKVAQKRQQLVVWFESPGGGVQRRRFLERSFLECKVRAKVDLRSLDRLVSQPQGDHAAIDTRLQELPPTGLPPPWRPSPLLAHLSPPS